MHWFLLGNQCNPSRILKGAGGVETKNFIHRQVRVGNYLFRFSAHKVAPVLGVSSQVAWDKTRHWLLADFDGDLPNPELALSKFHFSYKTPHGYHGILFKSATFAETAKRLLSIDGIDKTWVSIGIKRGYWFLRTYERVPIQFAGLCTFMKVER